MVSSFDRYDRELVELRQLVNRKREHYPELTLEECVHLAVEEMADAALDKSPEFREWLLQRVSDGGSPDKRRKPRAEDSPPSQGA